MTIKQLRAFLAVAQTLSFAQACERLHLSQPALSLAVRGLEESLGGRLFSRSTRVVELTPEGESFYAMARHLVAEWDRLELQMRERFSLQHGRVSVAAMPSFACNRLPLVLRDFRRRHPNINVVINDVINEQVIDMVSYRQVELGIAFEPESLRGLDFTPLYTDRFVAVVPRGSSWDARETIRWGELLEHDFIALQHPSAVRRMLEENLALAGLELCAAYESHHLATIGRMVACELGVSAVPSLCIGQMEELGARCIELQDPMIERRIGILTPGDRELSVAAQALHEALLDSGSLDFQG